MKKGKQFENGSDIERLLAASGITNYDIYLTRQPAQHFVSENNKKNNNNSEKEKRRHEVIMGETVDLTVDITPNRSKILNRSTSNKEKNFVNVFNLRAVADDKLEETCLDLWHKLFNTLYMKSYMSNTMPTYIVSSSGMSSSTSVIIKKMGSNTYADSVESDEDIDFYVFKGVSITKQTINSHAVSMKNVSETKGDGRSFHTQVHVDDTRLINDDIPLYLVTELYISSEQFSDLIVKTLADTNDNMQQRDSREKELDLMLAYETSRQYIKEKIFLCALCIPVAVINPLNISWSSQLFSNKAYVQLHVLNNHPEYEVMLKDSNMHLLESKIVRHLSPRDAVRQICSTNAVKEELQKEAAHSRAFIEKQAEFTELYETFVDKNIFPLLLKPKEQYSITFLVCPSDRSVRNNDDKMGNSNLAKSSHGAKSLRKKKSTPIVQGNMLSECSTPITIDYAINGLNCDLKHDVEVRWVSINFTAGIQMSIKCPESVTLLQPFHIEILISNYTSSDCDLTLKSQLTPESALICQDSSIDIGVIKVNDSGRFKLCFVPVQNGLQQLNQLLCVNKRTNQQFMFPFPVYLMVTDEMKPHN